MSNSSMSRAPYVRICGDILNNPTLQRLPPDVFRRLFLDAAKGQSNSFSAYVRPDSGRPSPAEWYRLRAETFARDDYTCTYCGIVGGRLECDHVIPVSRGGSHDPGNLTTACFACNRSKRDKLVEEWRA